MTPTTDPFHPDSLRIDPQSILKKVSKNGQPLPKEFSAALRGMSFVLLPTASLAKMAVDTRSPELAILIKLCQRWFVQYQKNPIPLAQTEIKGFKVSRWQKYRALKKLEKWGFISVERRIGKAPIITLLWRLPKS
jgi:hypothetical protein